MREVMKKVMFFVGCFFVFYFFIFRIFDCGVAFNSLEFNAPGLIVMFTF